MRRRTYYLALFPGMLALAALLPIYPVQATAHPSFGFAPMLHGAFVPATEILGGGGNWTTYDYCILDGTETRYEASPAVWIAVVAAAVDLWIFLVALLSNTRSREARRAIIGCAAAGVIGAASSWMEWYSIGFIGCLSSLSGPRVVAASLAFLSFAIGLSLLVLTDRLGNRMGPRIVQPAVRNAKPPSSLGGGT